jgi:hypothetical protein
MGAGSARKTHVTACGIGPAGKDPEAGRRKAPRATHVGCSSRSTRGCGLGCVSGRAHESDRGFLGEATGVSEARWVRGCVAENAMREPELPAEADRCVVKRSFPQSPFPGKQAMERERSVCFEKMLGTREARVLVVRSSGKQKSVGTHRVRAPSGCRKTMRSGRVLAHRRPSYR